MKLRDALFGKNLLSFCLMMVGVVLTIFILDILLFPLFNSAEHWVKFVAGYTNQTIVLLASVYVWFIRRFPEEKKLISFQSPGLLRLIGYVVFLFISYFTFAFFVLALGKYLGFTTVPGFAEQVSLLAPLGNGVGLIAAFVIAVLIAPVVEEYVFRGWCLICLPTNRYPLLAIILNGILFALLHFQLSSILPLLFLGSMLAFIRIRSNSLLPGILFHMINNSLAFLTDYHLR